jgi:hypothetical protein
MASQPHPDEAQPFADWLRRHGWTPDGMSPRFRATLLAVFRAESMNPTSAAARALGPVPQPDITT